MKWTEISAGELQAAEQRLWGALGEEAESVVYRINLHPAFLKEVANQILISLEMSEKLTTSLNPQWLRARKIMGKNFFGVEEAVKYLMVNPHLQQLVLLSEIPFSEAVLEELKETHILVAKFPRSIFDIRYGVNKGLFQNQDWYEKRSFIRGSGEVGWHLVRKTEVIGSVGNDWQKQQALISKDDEVPSVQVMVYTIIGHYLATGERLFKKVYVRTSSVSEGGRIIVGFRPDGFFISSRPYESHDRDLGVASARKPDKF